MGIRELMFSFCKTLVFSVPFSEWSSIFDGLKTDRKQKSPLGGAAKRK
jgi:hypothetical protein